VLFVNFKQRQCVLTGSLIAGVSTTSIYQSRRHELGLKLSFPKRVEIGLMTLLRFWHSSGLDRGSRQRSLNYRSQPIFLSS